MDGTTGGLTIVDQKLTATGADGGGYTLESETDFVRVIDIAASSGGYLAFGWRLQSPGSGAWDSYAFVGQGTTWEIRRYDNATPTVLVSEGVESSLTALDKIGVRVVGTTEAVTERFYAISTEQKLQHPGVVAVRETARRQTFH